MYSYGTVLIKWYAYGMNKDGYIIKKDLYITHVERALGSQRTILKNDKEKNEDFCYKTSTCFFKQF